MQRMPPVIGFIGLGQMGRPMAANLIMHGYQVFGFDTQTERLAQVEADGVRVCRSIHEVGTRADVFLLSLPSEQVVEQVLLGTGGIEPASWRGKVVIDTSTTTVSLAQRIARVLAQQEGAFLDAPVTGGISGAQEGTLSIMVGGELASFDRCRPIFAVLGSNIVHVGPSGHGQAAKMVNQMLMAAIYTSVAEAFAFAAQLGVDVAKVYQAVEHGGAQSKLLSGIKPNLLAGITRTNGNINQHGKDIDYIIDEANLRKLPLPITSSVHEFYKLARSTGFGHIWSGEMWAVWEKLLGIKLTDTIQSGGGKEG